MSPENGRVSPESKVVELSLGLPGSTPTISDGGKKYGTKRGFLDTVDLNKLSVKDDDMVSSIITISPPSKVQVMGWPPVRTTRKLATTLVRKYVKVAVDGAIYMRKIDLESYKCYEQLLGALVNMFTDLTIRCKVKSGVNEYVPTYQDRDGDWMLLGDVPWKMFVDTCKRLRLMKSGDALGLSGTKDISKQSLILAGEYEHRVRDHH